ncbi:AAA family ATPase [Sunxiuqinia rutila]|uniref:AAA family ATPase n=1 Tax=Sunxiuqinia rutila TaxID=1397841 RepID=UPI003D36F5DC
MSKAGTYSTQGDDYQRAVAINWIIKLITDDTIKYIQVESNGLLGIDEKVTVDDIVVVYKNGDRRHIQAKKNQTQERSWLIRDWRSELPKILFQLEQGKHIEVELYSATPLGEFTTLPRECRSFLNFSDFREQLSLANDKALSSLVKEWNRSEEDVFNLLKRIRTGVHHNTEEWGKVNKDSLTRIVTHPSLALDTLEAFINKHQSKDLTDKLEIRSIDVWEEFASKGLTRLPNFSEKEIIEQFNRTSAIGISDWKRTIVGEKIVRKELGEVLEYICDKKRTILVQDRPGSGKTCLLLDLADEVESNSKSHLLFIKGDRFVNVANDDGSLPKEIVESCGLLSSSKHVVVIIDSLDVLSCQRDHAALNYFLKLIDQLQIIQNLTIVAACREFDLKYDPKLRERKWDVAVKLKDFDFQETVLPILNRMDVKSEQLNSDLKELLCLPQNLSLFERVADYAGIFNVRTTYDLYKAFIDFTLRQDPDIEGGFFEKIFAIAEQLLRERDHSLPKVAIGIEEHLLHNLISKGVLNEQADGKIGFSHQTLFDNFVAGNALQNRVTLSELILQHPPLPFYRPSVRSYLFFVRSQSFKAFSRNIRDTLENKEIAYHFKRLVVETYAEMIPINNDWNLLRWIFVSQNDLFKRFFWVLNSSHWFELIANKWYPSLAHRSDSYEWHSAFIRKLDAWMNVYPNEIVELWSNALQEDWGKDSSWFICRSLARFQHYGVNGVKNLISKLNEVSNRDNHFMGIIFCNYIEATGEGYNVLWDWMTRDISLKEANRRRNENELHCENHDLKDTNFLKKHLIDSEEFLNLVLKTLLEWVDSSHYWKESGLQCKLLEYTSISEGVSHFSSIYIGNISTLVQAVEEAIENHARIKSKWWKREEDKFQQSNELAFRYIVVKAYLENIESNLDGITTQLLDKELLESARLNFELGLLINQSFHLLSTSIQDKIMTVIENLFSERKESEERYRSWHDRVRFELFIQIPACFRSELVNSFIDKFIPQFGYYMPVREKYSRGGVVYSPIRTDILDNLSMGGLYSLFSYYKDYNGHSFHPADGNSGGIGELSRAICGLAKNNPDKYLRIVNEPKLAQFSDSIIKAILEGVGSHISCRQGKVNDSSYNPITPLHDINDIARRLLDAIETKYSSFDLDITYARMIEDSIDGLSNEEDLQRITRLLIPLSNHPDPDGERLNVRRLNDDKITADDIANNSINCTRGVVANAAVEVLNKLLEMEITPFDSIISLAVQLANDKAEEVRAALLWRLAYTGYKNKELGWQIFNIIFEKKQIHLWSLAERFLYNQYYQDFEMVKPCLDKIRDDAISEAGGTWARLSALCMLRGHFSKNDFFTDLREIDKQDVWDGALSVFIANLEKNPDGNSQECFIEFMTEKKVSKEFGYKIDRAFDLGEKGKFINDRIGRLFIDSLTLDEDKAPKMHYFFEWIEYQATINPIKALELCECLLAKLQSFESTPKLWHPEPLISTLTGILREADEMDDFELINRAVNLQDQFLMMGLDGMDEYLEEAAML